MGTKKITKLLPDQEARFGEFVEKWIKIGLCAEPADRPRAEVAIRGLYALAKLREPRIIWLPCPISAALSAICYAAIIQERLVPNAASKKKAVYSAVRSAVDSAVRSAVRSAVDSAVRSAVYSAVRSAVYSAVYSAVDSAVDSAVRSAVDSAVGSAVYSAVRSAVGSAVRSAVDSAVDSAVYSAVRSAVYSAVYSAVDSAVDSAVRSAVDSAVGSAVRSAVGSAVGSAVYSAGYSYYGGSIWGAGYSAWADYFNEVVGVAIDRHYLETVESCGFFWLLDDLCFASERPSKINRDARGRLHCESGQSIGYPSGWGLWHWHGVQVPQWAIEQPTRIKVGTIEAERNAEVRRVLIERYGQARYLEDSGAQLVGEDEFGKLYRKEIPDDEPLVMVKVRNSTPEPDGSVKDYFIRVPPGTKTPHEAVAWTFGMTPKQYLPLAQT